MHWCNISKLKHLIVIGYAIAFIFITNLLWIGNLTNRIKLFKYLLKVVYLISHTHAYMLSHCFDTYIAQFIF